MSPGPPEVSPVRVDLNLNVRGMGPSATVAINDRSDDLRAAGRDVCKLGLGQSPFPVPEPVVEALAPARPREGVPPHAGPAGAARRRSRLPPPHPGPRPSTPTTSSIGPGSKELMFLLQLVYYGDIIIPTPAWVSYAPQAQIIGRHVSWLRTSSADGWCVTPKQLDHLCDTDPDRPRILVLNYPATPPAAPTARPSSTDLADVARRYGVLVLSDEIYSELHHHGRHWSIGPRLPGGHDHQRGPVEVVRCRGLAAGDVSPSPLRSPGCASRSWPWPARPTRRPRPPSSTPRSRPSRGAPRSRSTSPAAAPWCGPSGGGSPTAQRGRDPHGRPDGAFYLFPDFPEQAELFARRGIRSSTSSASPCSRRRGWPHSRDRTSAGRPTS